MELRSEDARVFPVSDIWTHLDKQAKRDFLGLGEGKLIHDFRRTAVRNLVRAGFVSEDVRSISAWYLQGNMSA